MMENVLTIEDALKITGAKAFGAMAKPVGSVCEGLKMFFVHSAPMMREMRDMIMSSN